jgi:dTDP-4-amino-4,6-dideoxygalactose transaminase
MGQGRERARTGPGPRPAIPLLDLRSELAALRPEIDEAIERVLASGQFIGGPEVEGFEGEFAAACGVAHAVGVNSGTDALRFALMVAGLREGDEAITSPLTFIAASEAVSQAGGRPVFADIDPATFNLGPREVERALTSRTKAIVPVHLYGRPAEMDAILDLARGRGAAVIEDACQAHGAAYKGRPVGSFGDAGCFSFYPTKNLGACGEGGMVTTARADIAERVRRLRDHGQSEKYVHAEEGYNGRLDALQAAILRVKLKRLPAWNERRRALAARYQEGLRDVAAGSAAHWDGKGIVLPREAPGARHVYHQFVVRVRNRDRVRAALGEQGIDTAVHYPVPLHLQPCYAWMGLKQGSYPEAERAAREVLSLPLYPEMTDDQVERVCAALRAAVGGR